MDTGPEQLRLPVVPLRLERLELRAGVRRDRHDVRGWFRRCRLHPPLRGDRLGEWSHDRDGDVGSDCRGDGARVPAAAQRDAAGKHDAAVRFGDAAGRERPDRVERLVDG